MFVMTDDAKAKNPYRTSDKKFAGHSIALSALTSLILFSFLAGCKDAVSVVQGPEIAKPLSPEVNSPTISLPSQNPYYSNDNTLIISGLCSPSHLVRVNGDFVDKTPCVDNKYSFEVPQSQDQLYYFLITQFFEGHESKPVALSWHRKSSVAPPSLAYPMLSPHASEETVLSVTGYCESGASIELQNEGVGQAACVDSQFAINLPKFADGDYNIDVVQTDLAGNSAQISILWKKHALIVSPATPQIVANSQQVFSATGGSEVYTINLTSNNSGAIWNPATLTYQAGTTAGVIDQLSFVDALGATVVNDITVVAAAPDHIVLPIDSGDTQTKAIGQNLDSPLKIQVVDAYGNGVSAFQVLFQLAGGDINFLDSQLQITDTAGFAQLNVQQGLAAIDSRVVIKSAVTNLPDVNNTNKSLAFLNLQATTQNSNIFDLLYGLGNNADNITLGDLNNDGEQDAIILNRADPSISLMLGTGSLKLSPQTKITSICSTPSAIVTGNFNADANLDLLFACTGPDTFNFLPGNGDGTFGTLVSTPVSGSESLPNAITVADFNGDTKLDFAMTSIGLSVVAIRMGVGDGTFLAPTVIAAGSSPNKISVGDFDQLNGLDLAILNAGNDMINIFLNNGAGVFSTGTTFSTGVAPSALVVDDFNNDGGDDVAVVNNVDNNVYVFLNDLAGSFSFPTTTAVGQSPIDLTHADLDGDGNKDLAVTNNIDNTISLLFGNGNGTFTTQTINSVANPIAIASTDTNGDSTPDLFVVSNGQLKLQLIPGQPARVFGFTHNLGNGSATIVTADFNSDGFMDQLIPLAGDNDIQLLQGNGSGLFQTIGTIGTSSNPKDLLVRDLDGDGNMDILVVAQAVNSIQVFIGLGSNSFATPVSYATGTQPAHIISNDFNGDSKLDILVTNAGSNTISFFPGNGDGSFGTRMDTNGSAQPTALTAGDLNSDGLIDAIVANESNGTIGIYLGIGDGTFSPPGSYTAQAGTNGVVAGYFNADSFLDVATSNNLASSVSVFFGAGDGSLGVAVNYFSGANPTDLRMGDFNGDGQEDLVVANGIGLKITVLRGSFLGDFSSSDILTTGADTFGLDVSDVNGDGSLDLSYINGFTNKSHLWLGL